MLKFKVSDKVKIMQGKDKGREGQIEKLSVKNLTAVIPGINLYKKHAKGSQGQKGGIFEIPRPVLLAKLKLICPKCKKPARVGFKQTGNTKARVCSACKHEIDTK